MSVFINCLQTAVRISWGVLSFSLVANNCLPRMKFAQVSSAFCTLENSSIFNLALASTPSNCNSNSSWNWSQFMRYLTDLNHCAAAPLRHSATASTTSSGCTFSWKKASAFLFYKFVRILVWAPRELWCSPFRRRSLLRFHQLLYGTCECAHAFGSTFHLIGFALHDAGEFLDAGRHPFVLK